jgi:hypothetical protein
MLATGPYIYTLHYSHHYNIGTRLQVKDPICNSLLKVKYTPV